MSPALRDRVELHRHTPRRDIQGLRALAVLVVVLFHARLPIPGGFVGVDVFFVISGFVITSLLMRERARTGRTSFSGFFTRRLRRLFPALALMVVVVLALTALLGSPFNGQQEVTALTGAGAIVGLANVVLILKSGNYFATPPTANPLLNTWSLSVEEQFYVVFPFLLVGLWVLANRLRWRRSIVVISGLTAFSAVSFALCLLMSTGVVRGRLSDPLTAAFYASPTRAWEFAVGAILALMLPLVTIGKRQATGLLVLGIAGIVVACLVFNEQMVFPGAAALLPVLATAMAIAGGRDGGGPLAALLRSKPAVWLGDLSYSWYLWHWPLIAFALLLMPEWGGAPMVGAIISLPVAWLSFRYVENPLRFRNDLSGRRLVVGAATGMAVTVMLAGLLVTASRALWWNDGMVSMEAQVGTEHLWITTDCDTSVPLGSRSEACTINPSATGAPIYLVGDSQAGMLSEGLAVHAARQNRPLLLGTMGACPFIDATLIADGRPDEACDAFVQDSLTWLVEQEPGTVVIGVWAAYMWLDGLGLQQPSAQVQWTSAGRMEVFRKGLERVVRTLADAGHRVAVLGPVPGFPEPTPDWAFWYPYQCSTWVALGGVDRCGSTVDATVTQQELEPYRAVFVSAVAERGDIIDLTPYLCDGGECRTNTGNRWLYMDGQHITVGESERLADAWTAIG